MCFSLFLIHLHLTHQNVALQTPFAFQDSWSPCSYFQPPPSTSFLSLPLFLFLQRHTFLRNRNFCAQQQICWPIVGRAYTRVWSQASHPVTHLAVLSEHCLQERCVVLPYGRQLLFSWLDKWMSGPREERFGMQMLESAILGFNPILTFGLLFSSVKWGRQEYPLRAQLWGGIGG